MPVGKLFGETQFKKVDDLAKTSKFQPKLNLEPDLNELDEDVEDSSTIYNDPILEQNKILQEQLAKIHMSAQQQKQQQLSKNVDKCLNCVDKLILLKQQKLEAKQKKKENKKVGLTKTAHSIDANNIAADMPSKDIKQDNHSINTNTKQDIKQDTKQTDSGQKNIKSGQPQNENLKISDQKTQNNLKNKKKYITISTDIKHDLRNKILTF